MNKITFKSNSRTTITIDDGKTTLPFFLEKTEFNDIQLEHNSYTTISRDGEYIKSVKMSPLPLSFTIGVTGENHQQLKESIKIARTALAPLEEAVLIYNRDGKEHYINCFIQSAPVVILHNQLYATITVSLVAPFPFWRVLADDITLTCAAGATETVAFTANTDYKVPAYLTVTCLEELTGTATETAVITLTAIKRATLFGEIPVFGGKDPSYRNESQNTKLSIAKNLARNDSFAIDWGVQGRLYTSATDQVDFIRSSVQYIYPGENRLTITVPAKTGKIQVVIRRFDYVRAV